MTTNDLRNYFNRKKPSGGITLLAFGILLFLTGIAVDGGYLCMMIGAAMAVGGIFMIAENSKQQSNSAVDQYCGAQADEYFATKKTIVDSYGGEVLDAIYTSGYCFENIFHARKAFKGSDNIWRSSIFEMSCLFFTENVVYYYDKKISLLTDEQAEKQKDFKPQDIAMVSLEEINQAVVIAMTIPGNEKIYVNCRNKEDALQFCGKIKERIYQRGNGQEQAPQRNMALIQSASI